MFTMRAPEQQVRPDPVFSVRMSRELSRRVRLYAVSREQTVSSVVSEILGAGVPKLRVVSAARRKNS
jgi:hypothetical protein